VVSWFWKFVAELEEDGKARLLQVGTAGLGSADGLCRVWMALVLAVAFVALLTGPVVVCEVRNRKLARSAAWL
jgi:hypothetical protein